MSSLYPHNQFVYDKLKLSLKTNNKACIIQPTGTGKSYITAEFLKENPNKNFLLLTSNSYIINQFDNIFNNSYNNYIYKTYPSLISNTFNELLKEEFDYIFLDEFHRIGAELWGAKVKLLLSHYPNIKVVGLTATHIRYMDEDNDLIKEYFDDNLVNHLTLMECFNTGILPRPIYISAIYNIDNEYNILIDKINKSKSSNKSELKKRIIEYKAKWEFSNGADIVLKKHIKKERNFLIFCRDIKHLEEMILTVKNWFKIFKKPINTFKVYSEYNNSEKELKAYRLLSTENNEEFNLLFSVQQLNEGLHAPNVHGIVFLRPTESHIIYYQQLGRGLSSKGNQPIVFDMVNNFKKSTVHTDFSKNSYEPIFRNDYLKTEYDKYKFSFDIIDEVKNIEDIFSTTLFHISDWNIKYNILKNQLIDRGNYFKIDKELVKWLDNQTMLFKNTQNLILWNKRKIELDKLNNLLGFKWNEQRPDYWISNFNKFKEALIIAKDYDNLDRNFKMWFVNVRIRSKKKGLNNVVWIERTKHLNSLNELLGFNWDGIMEGKINEFNSKLNSFKNELIKKGDYSKIDSKYKSWLYRYQSSYLSNGNISSYKLDKLNTLNDLLNFDWKIKQLSKWDKSYNEIKTLLIDLKDYNLLPSKHKTWLTSNKRRIIKNPKGMSKIRKEKLNALNSYGFNLKIKSK